jgi:hypothetical protein
MWVDGYSLRGEPMAGTPGSTADPARPRRSRGQIAVMGVMVAALLLAVLLKWLFR